MSATHDDLMAIEDLKALVRGELDRITLGSPAGDFGALSRARMYLDDIVELAARCAPAPERLQAPEHVDALREIERLRNQVAVALQIVAAGVEIMTGEQVGRWVGVGTFLEQETADYEGEPSNV